MSKIKDAVIDDLNKEKPILMSTPMVQATLKDVDPKTQTRRTKGLDKINLYPDNYKFVGFKNTLGYPASEGILWAGFQHKNSSSPIYFKCPYGQVGDRLWVRETWSLSHDPYSGYYLHYRANKDNKGISLDTKQCPDNFKDYSCGSRLKWKPSIFMPRWASRITLEITDIKVQRLQEITEEDAKAEGCYGTNYPDIATTLPTYRCVFENIWNSINGKKYSWADNPWVWVISFKRV